MLPMYENTFKNYYRYFSLVSLLIFFLCSKIIFVSTEKSNWGYYVNEIIKNPSMY